MITIAIGLILAAWSYGLGYLAGKQVATQDAMTALKYAVHVLTPEAREELAQALIRGPHGKQ